MVKTYKLHKFFGLSAGLVVLILSITGFFLDHDKWNFLYTTTFKSYPSNLKNKDKRLFTSYYIDSQNSKHIVVGSKRGLFESYDGGTNFKKILPLEIQAIKATQEGTLYFATSDGIYQKIRRRVRPYLLEGKYINALALSENKIVAVEDKHTIYIIDQETKGIEKIITPRIAKEQLQEDIKLSRFVRDLHYGRGLFEGDISLLINDYGALILTLLGLSGFVIWYLIYRKKAAKPSRRWIKYHANILTVISVVPVLILLVTGIFLDHAHVLGKFMKSVTIPHAALPPVYDSLEHDVWSIDYDGKVLRIGNRYGIYKSDDMGHWQLESRGFGYSMIRQNGILYVGGMGAANRVYDGSWQKLPHTPHMFKDVIDDGEDVQFFSSHKTSLPLPRFEDITLYSLLLALHDGSFFASWWVWVNDYAAVAMALLFLTGIWRWYKKRKA